MIVKQKKPIRVLQVVPILGYGGVEKMVTRYFQHLDHHEVMFDFIAHGDYEPYHDELISQGCKIYYLPTLGKAGYLGYKKAVKEAIPLEEYDIIHVHIGHITGLYASVFRSLCKAKIICHAHTTKCMSKAAFLMPIFRFLAKTQGHQLLACGKEAGKFCFGTDSFQVMPNGLSYEAVKAVSKEAVAALRQEFSLAEGAPVLGHVGHFSAPKNHPFLVQIIHDYLKKDPKARFILVGDGPDQENIRQMVKENGDEERVLFTGVRRDVPVLMKLFDLFLLPSLHEGLPLVGVEAQAAGTPCLFSDTIDQTVDAGMGISRFLPIHQGTTPWVEAIEQLLEHPVSLQDEDIFNGLCKTGYEITVSAQRLLEIYQGLIQ